MLIYRIQFKEICWAKVAILIVSIEIQTLKTLVHWSYKNVNVKE